MVSIIYNVSVDNLRKILRKKMKYILIIIFDIITLVHMLSGISVFSFYYIFAVCVCIYVYLCVGVL